ncbi:MAG TPA: SLC13 family permease, partial [Candidatus Goldiibacteriota bacterium]|nr:SLC13 family permease [Candidatus Goldiibacteriota bacterium]
LVFFLCFLSFFLSMLLTNDIALFIVVPLTLAMSHALAADLEKAVIFEAIAVNAGSTLTPIGNPQNIFIWHKWGISFPGFMAKMLPVSIVMAATLCVFITLFFKKRALHGAVIPEKSRIKKRLAVPSVILLVAFIAALQYGFWLQALPVIILFYLFVNREVLRATDWLLIVTFILMFIDFGLIAGLGTAKKAVAAFPLSGPGAVMALSAGISQLISNVPGAIFMSGFSTNWKEIAWGANLAGNGIVIGSLANIIALRLLKPSGPAVFARFHIYSVPFFLITFAAVFLITKTGS